MEINLNDFEPRDYQTHLAAAVEAGFRKIIIILPRRGGKDISTWAWCIEQAIKKTITIWYIFPEYAQAKRVIFNGMTADGKHYVNDFIPSELIARKNSQDFRS